MTGPPELFGEPGDAPARAAIRSELDTTLFVEAGAGTGKTAALVDRVVALVSSDTGGGGDPIPMSAIAAITFTEKAAAELRDRVRKELRLRAGDPAQPDRVRVRCEQAIADLDGAAICTLHAFAQRILTEFPIESGLPPRIEVRDEITSRIAFDDRWREFVDELLDDASLESTILVLLASNVKLNHLRTVAEILDDNWDLLDRIEAPRTSLRSTSTVGSPSSRRCARPSPTAGPTPTPCSRASRNSRSTAIGCAPRTTTRSGSSSCGPRSPRSRSATRETRRTGPTSTTSGSASSSSARSAP